MKLMNIIILTYVISVAADIIIQTPGIQKHDPGDNATLLWTLSKPFDTSSAGASIDIHKGDQLMVRISGHAVEHTCTIATNDPRLDCVVQGEQVGINLSDINYSDASNYTISVQLDLFGEMERDGNALIYVYGTPLIVMLGNITVIVGSPMSVTCDATSQSVQPNPPVIEPEFVYTWDITNPTNNHVIDGDTVRIPAVVRENNRATFKCSVIEETSTLPSDTDSVVLNILYRPDLPTVEGVPSSPIIEGTDGISLTCLLSGEDLGNPPAHVYHWRNQNSTYETDTDNNKLDIAGSQVTAGEHDGIWQCQAENTVGPGQNQDSSITVNARAQSDPDLPHNHTTVADEPGTLQVTCGFTSKPGAVLTWTYNGSPTLPPGVTTSRLSPPQTYPYTTVRDQLMWSGTSTLEQRRQSGGIYQCHGCVDLASSTDMKESREATVNIEYYPHDITLTGGGHSHVAVAGQTDPVTRTCVADCKPDCSYRWENQQGTVTNTDVLNFDPLEKEDHGDYTCYAYNKHFNGGITATFSLTVNYIPEITSFNATNKEPVETDEVILTCDISSRPDSDIAIVYKANNSVLTSSKGQRAVFTFDSVQCLDTGIYECSANNEIGTGTVTNSSHINVICPFSPQIVNKTIGKSIGDNHTFIEILTANPFYDIYKVNWTFTPMNYSLRFMDLPDNVDIVVLPAGHEVQRQLQLRIWLINETNFGVYRMTAGNGYGSSAVVAFSLESQSLPYVPSAPNLAYATSVSLNIYWTAEFNGGFPQTFTVIYTNHATDEQFSQAVITDGDISTGDMVRHKLQDVNSVLPGTTYKVQIMTDNEFDGGSQVYGKEAYFTTDPKTSMVDSQPPIVKLDGENGVIIISLNILNPEYLSHIEIQVCVTVSPDTCENVTVRDFTSGTVNIPSPDTSAARFTFTLAMFDNEDVVYQRRWAYEAENTNRTAIGAGVGAAAACLVIIIVILVLWRKGIFDTKQPYDKQQTTHDYVNGDFQSANVSPPNEPTYEEVSSQNLNEQQKVYENQTVTFRQDGPYQCLHESTQQSKEAHPYDKLDIATGPQADDV